MKDKNVMCEYCYGTNFKEGIIKEIPYFRCSNEQCSYRNVNVSMKQLKITYKVWKNGYDKCRKDLDKGGEGK